MYEADYDRWKTTLPYERDEQDCVVVEEFVKEEGRCFLEKCKLLAKFKIRMFASGWAGSATYDVCFDHKDAAEEIFIQALKDEADFVADLKSHKE